MNKFEQQGPSGEFRHEFGSSYEWNLHLDLRCVPVGEAHVKENKTKKSSTIQSGLTGLKFLMGVIWNKDKLLFIFEAGKETL